MSTEQTPPPAAPSAPRWLTESILLACVPVVAYWITYRYERGYCDYFRIPHELINLSLTSIFGFVSAVAIITYHLCMTTSALAFRASRSIVVREFLSLPLTYLCILLLIGFNSVPSKPVFYWLIVFVAISAARLWWDATRARKQKLPLAQWLEERRDKEDKAIGAIPELPNSFVRTLGRPVGWTVFCLLCVAVLAFWYGGWSAGSEERFPVLSASPDTIVLRIYGENAVCAKVDRAARKILPEYCVVKLSGDQRPFVRLEHFGPLELAPVPLAAKTAPSTAPAPATTTTSPSPAPAPSATQSAATTQAVAGPRPTTPVTSPSTTSTTTSPTTTTATTGK